MTSIEARPSRGNRSRATKKERPAPVRQTGGSPSDIRIAFLGMGKMGAPMAKNLVKAGYKLTVWNRTPAKAKPLRGHGASIATDAASAVAGADVVITMLSTGPAVGVLLFDQGVAAAMRPGTTVVDMSSIPPHSAAKYADALKELGIAWLDAPVSGGTKGAESGTLTILVGGEPDAFIRCAPILESMGRATHIGPAGAGQTAKLANQIIVAATIGGVAEALLLSITAGLDPVVVREALSGGFAESRVLTEHGRRMTDRDFVPGGTVEQQLKDLDTALAEASELGLDLPLTANVTTLFRSLADSGDVEVDHSALFLELERLNAIRTPG